VHVVVFRHNEKSDPDAVYYGSLGEAVRAVEPGTQLFAVWGGVFNAQTGRFEAEDVAEDFLAAWLTHRRTGGQDEPLRPEFLLGCCLSLPHAANALFQERNA
jgi:hypothetical protein